MPQSQGSGSRGLNALRSESKEKCVAISRLKVLKSGEPTVSGRTITQKDNSVSSSVSTFDDDADMVHITKIKDFVRHTENTLGKLDAMVRSLSTSERTVDASILFPSMPSSSDASFKKFYASNPKSERAAKGKLAHAGGNLNKIEKDKVSNGNFTKMTSEVVEPKRSNRRI